MEPVVAAAPFYLDARSDGQVLLDAGEVFLAPDGLAVQLRDDVARAEAGRGGGAGAVDAADHHAARIRDAVAAHVVRVVGIDDQPGPGTLYLAEAAQFAGDLQRRVDWNREAD